MKKLNNFQEALEYVNRLGFAYGNGPIVYKQADLCAVAEALEKASGEYPYEVKFNRLGQSSVWRGCFVVFRQSRAMNVPCDSIKLKY